MPAGPCTGARWRKLPTGHPSLAERRGTSPFQVLETQGPLGGSRRPARLREIYPREVIQKGTGTPWPSEKWYHSNETMVGFAAIGVRSYVSEPDRGRRHWKGQAAARDAVYANRRRIRGARGKRLLRQRGELLERPNAHLYETGRMRRVHLRGHPNILKRLLVQVCGVNLGLLMRHLTGVGTPRSLHGRAAALLDALIGLLRGCWGRVRRFWAPERHDRPQFAVGWSGDTPIRTRDSRLTISPFCHGLLVPCV